MSSNRSIVLGMLISIASVVGGYYSMMFVAIFIAFMTMIHVINIDTYLRRNEK